MADGSITIETLLGTDKFDRQIAKLEKDMKKTEDKLSLKAKVFISSKGELLKQKREVEDLKNTYNSLTERIAHLNEIKSGAITPTLKDASDLQHYEQIIAEQNKVESNLTRAEQKQNSLNIKYERAKAAYKEISDRVKDYKTQIENVKIQKQVAEVDRLKESFKNTGNSIQSSINKVARLALGIFGLRSAYMALRRASSDLASYDDQYATNLEYIRYALTQMIAPVLKYIVNLAATLLGYINAIVQGWFGINLFSRGSVDNFKQMKTQANGVGKAVQEIKKQLAGFDEMNVLQEDGSTSTGGGGGGITMPDFDLSAMQGEPPAWLQWIIDNKDLILSILAGIAAGLLAIKLGASGIQALGIGVMVTGIIYTIQSLLKYLKDPSWENFGKVIQGIGIAIVGLGILIGNVPLIVAGAIVLIVGTIIKYWEQIKSFLQKGIDWLKNKSDWVHEMFGDTIGNIYDTFVSNLQLILNWFDMTFNNIKRILDGIIQFVKGVFTGNWQQAWEGIKNIFGGIFNWIGNTAKTVLQMAWNLVKNFAITGANTVAGIFKTIVNAVLRTIENILNSPIRTINRLIGVINAVPRNKLKYITNN